MKEEILEFIHRRFPTDNNWTTGNCYFFATILAARFDGKIYYEPIVGHFLFRAADGNFYDWEGQYNQDTSQVFEWDSAREIDSYHTFRIMRDCIL